MHAPIRRPFGRSGVLHRQKKAPTPTAPLHHPGARAIPCAIHSRSVALSPCAHADCHDDSSTRPAIRNQRCVVLDSWPPPKLPILPVLPGQLPASSRCLTTCFASVKKHLPPRLVARLAPVPRSLLETGIAASGKLGLEIISEIKGRRLDFPLWNAHAAAPDSNSNPLLRPVLGWLQMPLVDCPRRLNIAIGRATVRMHMRS